jgi:hypothetical protein
MIVNLFPAGSLGCSAEGKRRAEGERNGKKTNSILSLEVD